MGGSSETRAGTPAVDWRATGRVLKERALAALALGEALEGLAAGREVCPEALADQLQQIIGTALVKGTSKQAAVATAARKPHGLRSTAADPAVALRTLQSRDLSGQPWPLVWFGSAAAGAERVTLALGVRVDGTKSVIGLWPGGTGQQRLAQTATADLWARGLNRGVPWLAVTGGERALGQALEHRWGGRLALGHCQREVCAAVLAHLPAHVRAPAEQALRSAWDTPEVVAARAALQAMVDSWRETYPGAAARLRQEVEPTTTVQALGVHGAFAERLRTVAPAQHLLAQCLPAGRGHSGRAWLGCLASELLRRQAAFRRLAEAEEMQAFRLRLETGRGAEPAAR